MFGCDSLIFLDLTIYYSDTTYDVQEHCSDFTWINDVTYTSSNNEATYTLEKTSTGVILLFFLI